MPPRPRGASPRCGSAPPMRFALGPHHRTCGSDWYMLGFGERAVVPLKRPGMGVPTAVAPHAERLVARGAPTAPCTRKSEGFEGDRGRPGLLDLVVDGTKVLGPAETCAGSRSPHPPLEEPFTTSVDGTLPSPLEILGSPCRRARRTRRAEVSGSLRILELDLDPLDAEAYRRAARRCHRLARDPLPASRRHVLLRRMLS